MSQTLKKKTIYALLYLYSLNSLLFHNHKNTSTNITTTQLKWHGYMISNTHTDCATSSGLRFINPYSSQLPWAKNIVIQHG